MEAVHKFWHWVRKKNKTFFEQMIEVFVVVIPVVFVIRTVVFGLYVVPSGSMEPTLLVGERFLADKLTYWFSKPRRGDVIAFNQPERVPGFSQGFVYSENPLVNSWQRYVWGPENWTKRVIGLPGDHVQGRVENGRPVVYINGEKLDEPYVNPHPLIAVWHNVEAKSQQGVRRCSSPYCTYKTYDPAIPLEQQMFYRITPDQIRSYPGIPQTRQPYTSEEGGHDEFDVVLGPSQYWVMGDNRRNSIDSRWFGPLEENQIHGKIVFRVLSSDFPVTQSWLRNVPLGVVDCLPFQLVLDPINFWRTMRWNRCLQIIR